MDALNWPEEAPAMDNLQDAVPSSEIVGVYNAQIQPAIVTSTAKPEQQPTLPESTPTSGSTPTTGIRHINTMGVVHTTKASIVNQENPPNSTYSIVDTLILTLGILVAILVSLAASLCMVWYVCVFRRRYRFQKSNRSSMMMLKRKDKFYPAEVYTKSPVVGEWFFSNNDRKSGQKVAGPPLFM